MDEEFDPYFDWFGLSPIEGRPPDHYALLGIKRFEHDREKIFEGADLRMELLKQYQNGVHAKDSQTMLNEVSYARVCLTNEHQRAAYDKQLRERIDIYALPELVAPLEIFPSQLPKHDPLAGTYHVHPSLLLQPRDFVPEEGKKWQNPLAKVPYWVWLSVVGIASVLVAGYGLYTVFSRASN